MMDLKFISSFSNLSLTTAGLLLLAITVILLFLINRLISNLSSRGPWGIPILGYFPFLRDDYPIQLANLAKKYGDPYLISICGQRFLHLSSHDAVREAHVKNGECFPGRCEDFNLFSYVFKDGLLFQNDEPWRIARKFLIKSMRELGLGARDQMKDPISDSVREVINILNEKKGQPIDISNLLSAQCSEVIRRLLVGDDVSNDVIDKINDAYLLTLLPINCKGFLLFGNINRYLMVPWFKEFRDVFKAKKELDVLFAKILKEHKNNFDANDPKDLIDFYLLEKKNREEKGDPEAKYFTDQAFVPTLIQVFGDGGSGIGLVLAAFVKGISERIDIQNAMHEEIVREIGMDRLPTFEDRSKLPYVNAVIKECERTSNFVHLIPSLECCCDTTVSGVFVPKGTVTIMNFYAIHNNPSVYKNPEKFDPTRFLSDKDSKRPKEELPMTFNVGKKSCPGEELVISEIFLFLTAIIQRFTLELVDGNKLKAENKENSEQYWTQIQVIASPRDDSISK